MADLVPLDWQSNKSLAESNKYMWINKIDFDVTFLVGQAQEEVQAHKYILISRSSVFYTMFKGSLPVNPDKPIQVPDIEVDIFRQLLLYLYTDTVQITLDNVLALLHAAKIYMVQALIDKCLRRLKGKMSSNNLCLIMEASHVFGESQLREMCRTSILRNPKEVFPLDSMAELCSECLESLVKDDQLRMGEKELFECIVKYSEEKCRKEMLEVTPENQRLVLGKALQHVRFTLMEKEYFSNKVEPIGLLTSDESKAVLQYFLNPNSAALPPFNTANRDLPHIRIVKRFQVHNAGWTYNYRHSTDAISCVCDQDIMLHGVLLYGSSEGPKEFNAKIFILDSDKEPYFLEILKVKSDGQTKYYECLFKNPVLKLRDKIFTLSLRMTPGKITFYGVNGEDTVEEDGVTFKFMDSQLSTNNTNHSRGQIPGLIYTITPLPL